MIEVGARAPDFTLSDQDGNEVSLSDFRGRSVLLVFYPMDFSPVCTDQLTLYKPILGDLASKDVTMLGISVDHAFAHKAFQQQLGVDTPLLADFQPRGKVARDYGVFIEERGHNQRALVLVGPEGTVEWAHQAPTPLDIPGAELIVEALSAR
jgi:peroxiredoxin